MNVSRIQEIAEEFTNGTPISEEVFIGTNVVFQFDNPFEDDIEEPYVVASVMVERNAYDFNPESGDEFNDVDILDRLDSELYTAFKDGGFTGVSGPEYDSANSTPSYDEFVYTLNL